MSENRGSTVLEVTLAFLLGGLVGAGLALLYAPAPGEETRRRLRESAEKMRERFQEGYETVREKVEEGVGKVRSYRKKEETGEL